jgi:hypothetical protein
MKKSLLCLSIIGISSIILTGCGGSGDSYYVEDGWNGRLIDAPVDGVKFECGKVMGKTHDGGFFGTCPKGSIATFKLGKVILGSAKEEIAKKRNYNVFIEDVTDPETAIKVSMLLLSLDEEGGDNKIELPENADEIVNELILKDESATKLSISDIPTEKLQQAINQAAAVDETVKPIDIEEAKAHLDETKSELATLPPVKQPGEQTGAE